MNERDIPRLRQEIDNVDRTVLELLSKRIELAREIATQKDKIDLPILDKRREAQIKKQWKVKAEELEIPSISRILEAVLDTSKKAQTEVIK